MKPIDKSFRYNTAEETRAPGYLARKFAQIRKDLKREQEERAEKVKPLIRAKSKES